MSQVQALQRARPVRLAPHDYPMSARLHLATARVLRPLDPARADDHESAAWELAHLAGSHGLCSSPLLAQEPMLQRAARKGAELASMTGGRLYEVLA